MIKYIAENGIEFIIGISIVLVITMPFIFLKAYWQEKKEGIIEYITDSLVIKSKNGVVKIPIDEIESISLRERYGRMGISGGVLFVPIKTDENLLGYKAVIKTAKKKYVVYSKEVVSGEEEAELMKAAKGFKDIIIDIQKLI